MVAVVQAIGAQRGRCQGKQHGEKSSLNWATNCTVICAAVPHATMRSPRTLPMGPQSPAQTAMMLLLPLRMQQWSPHHLLSLSLRWGAYHMISMLRQRLALLMTISCVGLVIRQHA